MAVIARRAWNGLSAGVVALVLNMAALRIADLVGIPTAHGGLLRLLVNASGTPMPHGTWIQAGFHIGVGLAMALTYAVVLEPAWPGHPVRLGSHSAATVWLVNAGIVLPLAGEGFAGRDTIGAVGILWFAAAHVLFFLALAIGVAVLLGARRELAD